MQGSDSKERSREIVVPGDLLDDTGMRPGPGTFTEGRSIYAAQLGIKTVGFELALPRVPELHVGIAEAGTYADLVRAGKMG